MQDIGCGDTDEALGSTASAPSGRGARRPHRPSHKLGVSTGQGVSIEQAPQPHANTRNTKVTQPALPRTDSWPQAPPNAPARSNIVSKQAGIEPTVSRRIPREQPESLISVEKGSLRRILVSPFAAASAPPQSVRRGTGGELARSRGEPHQEPKGVSNTQISTVRTRVRAQSSDVNPLWVARLTQATTNLTSRLSPSSTLPRGSQTLVRPPTARSFVGQRPQGSSFRSGASTALSQSPPQRPEGTADPAKISSSSGFRAIKIGIETEFYLAARSTKHFNHMIDDFAMTIAVNHNKQVQAPRPRMREGLRPYNYIGPYTEWCLVEEGSVGSEKSPWGLEMVSPIFRAHPHSTWRRDVEKTWGYLQRHYDITKTSHCATHIHVSFESPSVYTADDIRRIARAVIHFEPALEALVPQSRRGNRFAKSNWLQGQCLGYEELSRTESIAAIDEIPLVNDQEDIRRVVELMQDVDDRDYCWNFVNLRRSRETIEFRKPPGSASAAEALSWAEFAMSFVQASVKHGTRDRLEKIPSNVGGLKWFLKQAHVPGVNEPSRLERIWKDKPDNAAVEPQPVLEEYWGEQFPRLEARFKKLAAADNVQLLKLAKTVRQPYW